MEDYKVGDKVLFYDEFSMTIEKGTIIDTYEKGDYVLVEFSEQQNTIYKKQHMIDKKYITSRDVKGREKLKQLAERIALKEIKKIEKSCDKNIKRIENAIEKIWKK